MSCINSKDEHKESLAWTIRESLSRKRQKTIISQTQFDELVLDYIIGRLLPIRQVDTPQFIEYSNGISSAGSTKFTWIT